MAFRQLDMKIDQVLRSSDYRRLEMELGLPFTSTQSMNINDESFFVLVAGRYVPVDIQHGSCQKDICRTTIQ